MSYVLAVVTQLASQQEVYVKARGQSISKAVDTVEIVRNRFVPELKVTGIKIGTDKIEIDNSGKKENINVSRIEIAVRK